MNGIKRLTRSAAVVLLMGGVAACGDDGPTGPQAITLDEVQGLYELERLSFDPQGAVDSVNVLAAMEAEGTTPTLNIDRQGGFQIFFRDPATGSTVQLAGTVTTTAEVVVLEFPTAQQASQFVLPQILELTWMSGEERLTFTGNAQISRVRLIELFPALGDEQLFDPTPGELRVTFGPDS